MLIRRRFFPSAAATVLASTVAAALVPGIGSLAAQDAPSDPDGAPTAPTAPTVVQPGAPGQATRVLTEDDPARVEAPAVTEADIAFMRGMIPHHAQALEMVAMIPGRTDRDAMRLLGRRIAISQRDEIAFLRSWLGDRNLADPGDHAGATARDEEEASGTHLMPGMLTADEMEELATAEGRSFERLFLELMIQHHEGALTMVEELLSTPGAAQDSRVDQFAAEVHADQNMEIRRMRSMLEDPRGIPE